MDSVLHQYDELFQPELSCYTGEPVVLNDRKGAKFHKDRAVPCALQSKVEITLLKMENDGVIQGVNLLLVRCPPWLLARRKVKTFVCAEILE